MVDGDCYMDKREEEGEEKGNQKEEHKEKGVVSLAVVEQKNRFHCSEDGTVKCSSSFKIKKALR